MGGWPSWHTIAESGPDATGNAKPITYAHPLIASSVTSFSGA